VPERADSIPWISDFSPSRIKACLLRVAPAGSGASAERSSRRAKSAKSAHSARRLALLAQLPYFPYQWREALKKSL
jgi:hypothetical protein